MYEYLPSLPVVLVTEPTSVIFRLIIAFAIAPPVALVRVPLIVTGVFTSTTISKGSLIVNSVSTLLTLIIVELVLAAYSVVSSDLAVNV